MCAETEVCAACGGTVPEWDCVWIDPVTRKATMTGNPYHPGCAPEQYPEDTVTLKVSREDAAFIARLLKWGEQGMCDYAQDRLTDWEQTDDPIAREVRQERFHEALADARIAGHMVPSLVTALTGQ